MLNISFNSPYVHILCLVYLAKDIKDWFAYGKLNVIVIQVPRV